MKIMLENLRSRRPLVHNITNYVTANDVANALLAIGASPIMADDADEAAEITTICAGTAINIGTLNRHTIPAMFAAGRAAQLLGRTLVLDPVGAGASQLRTKTALDLLREIHFDVVRGNISEIKTLALGNASTKGVDADVADFVGEENLENSIAFVKQFAARLGSVVAVTGAIDLVGDGNAVFVIRNGCAEMSRVTGTGCMLSALIAAFVSANRDHALRATAAAICAMGLAGEIARERLSDGDGNATFRNKIIDALDNLTGEILQNGAKFEIR